MTRKDYEAIARAFANRRSQAQYAPTDAVLELWGDLRMEIADILEADNPRFSRERFYAATVKEHEA